MNIQSLSAFCQSKGFIETADAIRENSNQYPFITFINEKNEAENVYFSKRAGAQVTVGQVITPELLKSLMVSFVEYEDGRPSKHKLCFKGESRRINIAEFLGR